jgi:hypothetical protein
MCARPGDLDARVGSPATVIEMPGASNAPWVWTSGPVVADGARALVIVVVNQTDWPFHYGVAGSLQRAEPGGWVPVGGFASSLDFWGRLGRFTAPDERVFVPAIGLGASAGGVGQAEYIAMAGLPTGRCRVWPRRPEGDETARPGLSLTRSATREAEASLASRRHRPATRLVAALSRAEPDPSLCARK